MPQADTSVDFRLVSHYRPATVLGLVDTAVISFLRTPSDVLFGFCTSTLVPYTVYKVVAIYDQYGNLIAVVCGRVAPVVVIDMIVW